jgi:hypothetical protein
MAPKASVECRGDTVLIGLAALHAAAVIAWPAAPLIAAGVWWNSNTISHNFIHRPFFRARAMNHMFSAALSVLLGIPQTLWRDRHFAHHAGREWSLRLSRSLVVETVLVVALWTTLLSLAPRFFLLTYFPGYLAGLALCAMHGYWEHAGGPPVSHYNSLYNLLCFNDGYHAEHHAAPGVHWTRLHQRKIEGARASSRSSLFRLIAHPLEFLERIVLRSPRLQRFVVRKHREAFASLLPQLAPVRDATIVGGGLFPRTALILHALLPAARLTILEAEPRHIETARGLIDPGVAWRNAHFIPGERLDCDLTVVPLCLEGDRAAVYRQPPSPAVLVHDWIWRPRGTSVVVSWLLLKRINLVRS